jgi:hypothetical protein
MLLAACAAPVEGPSDATAGASAAAAGCTTQVIVALATPVEGQPDATLVEDLARTAAVNLAYVRSLSTSLHVFELSAQDPDCGGALDRLRADPRVRSVDEDRRRTPQS